MDSTSFELVFQFRLRSHLSYPYFGSGGQLVRPRQLLPFVLKASCRKDILLPGRNNSVTTAFVADESSPRLAGDQRTVITQVIAQQQAALHVGKDRLILRD